MTGPNRTAVFDVCGTLYDANTTAGFVRHHHRRMANRFRQAIVFAVTSRKTPVRPALIVLNKILGIDLNRWLLIRTLSGEPVRELNISAKEYLSDLDRLAIRQTHDLLRELQASGWRVVLASNSINYVIEEVARHLSLSYVSSTVRDDKERSTGVLLEDLTGRKLSALVRDLGEDFVRSSLMVVTDNKSDRDLFEKADKIRLIAKHGRKAWMDAYEAEIVHI